MMFNNLHSYYVFLDSDCNYREVIFLSSNLKPLLNKLETEEDNKKCSFEICFQDFHFRKGEYIPQLAFGANCYPNLAEFDNLEYLRQRIVDCVNYKYRAKYCHLLHLKTNDKRDAINAVDNYFKFIISIELNAEDNSENRGYLNAFENLIVLSEKVKHKKIEVIELVKQNLLNKKLEGFATFHLMHFVSTTMKINQLTKEFFFSLTLQEIDEINFPNDREEFLKLAIGLAQKLNKPQKEYQNLLGDFYLDEAKKQSGNFLDHTYCLSAMNMFKKTANKNKLDEVSKLLEDSKKDLKLNKFEFKDNSPDIQVFFNAMDKFSTNLTEKHSSEIIYSYLINDVNLYPKASALEHFIKPQSVHFLTTISIDKNKNIGINKYKGINSYRLHFESITIQLLKQIFFKGQKNSKVNYESLKEYLEKYSWYSNEKECNETDGSVYSYKWLEFILPPIKLFFEQSEIDVQNSTHTREGYILAIDSLTLKFEGVLREFSNLIGAQIIEVDESSTEMRVNFDRLLENDKFIEVVEKDDVAFFKFLFTLKGLNLRNNIAHSFYTPKDYSASLMWLLVCAFLKLGDYEFK